MLMLPQDIKEAAAIERRRKFEEERRGRIFNARTRLIGVDKEALEKQIVERRLREEEERKLNDTFEKQRLHDDQVAVMMEKHIEEEKRKLNGEINTFRNAYQKPENRREFDIYDPDALKKSLPGRIFDDDPRCGISSAQKFEGEDLGGKERLVVQHQQNRSWLEQQIAERRTADRERKAAEEAYDAAMLTMDKRACDLDMMEQECRRRLDEANYKFNKALAEEQAHLRQLEASREEEDNQAEIFNCVTGDFLTENPEVAKSNMGPNRVVGFKYKGMTPKEREDVRNVQLQQIEERKRAEVLEARHNAEWEALADGTAHHIALMDRQLMRKKQELDKQLFQQNQQLSEEQKAHKYYIENYVYTNKPTAAYYQQFNTSTR